MLTLLKKEIRELIKKRKDYVPPPEIEKLMEEGKKASKESAMNAITDKDTFASMIRNPLFQHTPQIGGSRVAPLNIIEKTHILCKLTIYKLLNYFYYVKK